MTGRKTVSSEELERRLIADAHDPDAWEHVTTVSASRSPRPTWYGQSVRQAPRRQFHRTSGPNGDPKDQHLVTAYERALKVANRSAQIIQIEDARAKKTPEAVRRKRMHDAIAHLPEGQRRAVQLWLDGFNLAEIAGALGVTLDAVKSRVRDAKRHLRASLEERDEAAAR